MTLPRPARVGDYELLQDFEADGVGSVRVFRLRPDVEVGAHVHQQSAQIYVALEGRTVIERDGVAVPLEHYQAALVPAGTVHRAYCAGNGSVVMNISVPPLQVDDQAPVRPLG